MEEINHEIGLTAMIHQTTGAGGSDTAFAEKEKEKFGEHTETA